MKLCLLSKKVSLVLKILGCLSFGYSYSSTIIAFSFSEPKSIFATYIKLFFADSTNITFPGVFFEIFFISL